MNLAKQFKMPPRQHTQEGKARRVGYELEFNGLNLQQTADVLVKVFGGEFKQHSVAEATLEVDELGTFKIELDSAFVKKQAKSLVHDEHQDLLDKLAQVAGWVVPMEIVCPPIELQQMERLHPMIEALRYAGAEGTQSSPIAAFGVHINPEIPDLQPSTIHNYLRAYALLQWWLTDSHQLDPSRRITPYIDPYPEAYLEEILQQHEADMEDIFSSYLKHNPTRNRGLDMLPMLACIDAERVQAVAQDPRVTPRPTFHYRLPNSDIGDPNWSLAESWNHWWLVEFLADQPDQIDQLATQCLHLWRPVLGFQREKWNEVMGQWLSEQRLA